MQAVLKAQINKTDRNDARGMAQTSESAVAAVYRWNDLTGLPDSPTAILHFGVPPRIRSNCSRALNKGEGAQEVAVAELIKSRIRDSDLVNIRFGSLCGLR
jgi:hypothetical protein